MDESEVFLLVHQLQMCLALHEEDKSAPFGFHVVLAELLIRNHQLLLDILPIRSFFLNFVLKLNIHFQRELFSKETRNGLLFSRKHLVWAGDDGEVDP